jgi:hypothetical protein
VYAGQSAFATADGQNTLEDPLARNIALQGARFNDGMRRQMYEPTPLGYAIQNSDGADDSNAFQFEVAKDEWEKIGGRVTATSASESPDAAVPVYERVTIGEAPLGKGTLRVAGALLPQPTEKYDHQFGLEPYAATYTGYIMARNLLESINRSKAAELKGTIGGRFVISRRAVKLKKKAARVRVSCRTPLGCKGTLRLAIRVKTGKKPKGGKKRRTKLVRIGKRKFDYATKRRNAVIRVNVSKKGRRLARRQRRIRVHASAPVTFTDGRKGVARRSFWLYRPSGLSRRGK